MTKTLLLLFFCSVLFGCEQEKLVLDRYATMRVEKIPLPSNVSSQDLLTVDFISSEKGFVGGSNGTVLATLDGGQSWQDRSVTSLGTIYKLVFNTATIGWAAASTGLYRTTNSGQTWQQMVRGSLRDVQFVNSSIGYAVGDGTEIYKTTNGGQSWTSQWQNYWPGSSFRAVSFSTPDSGIVVGNHAAEFTTVDGGQTWRHYNDGIDSHVYNDVLKFRDPEHHILVGVCFPSGSLRYSSFVEKKPGAGSSSPDEQNTFPMYGVARYQNRIVAVGENTIIRYDPAYSLNEHTPWTRVHASDGTTPLYPFRSVDFADAATLYATGPHGLLMRLHY